MTSLCHTELRHGAESASGVTHSLGSHPSKSASTLVVLLGNARGGEETWQSMFRHVLEPLQADLALAFGHLASLNNSLAGRAKHVWITQEPDDWGDVIDEAAAKAGVSAARWREACRVNRFGLYSPAACAIDPTRDSGAIIFGLRHRLLVEHAAALRQYDWIVLTRSDFFYICDHPDISAMVADRNSRTLLVAEGESYGGYTDRHHVFRSSMLTEGLGVLTWLAAHANDSEVTRQANPERALRISWEQQGVSVRLLPRLFFTVRATGDMSRTANQARLAREWQPLFGHPQLELKYPAEFIGALKRCPMHTASLYGLHVRSCVGVAGLQSHGACCSRFVQHLTKLRRTHRATLPILTNVTRAALLMLARAPFDVLQSHPLLPTPAGNWQKWISSLLPSSPAPPKAATGVRADGTAGADSGGSDLLCGLVTNASSIGAFAGPTVDRVGPRSGELHCIAQREATQRVSNRRDLARHCCRQHNYTASVVPSVLLWPRAHVEAMLYLRSREWRTVDFSFVGSMSGDAVTSAERRWVKAFALRHFTNESEYVDTTATEGYTPLGVWDKTLQRLATALRPKHLPAASCGRSVCDLQYYASLARAKYVLAPAGDRPWSQRFFEAILAGAVPIVSNPVHTGRSAAERALPYNYLVADRVRALLRRSASARTGPRGHCSEWATRNLVSFLKHQTLGGEGWRGSPQGCSREPFAQAVPHSQQPADTHGELRAVGHGERKVAPLTARRGESTWFGRCAVVSSSENLLRHTFGPEIDARDEVVRINLAPVANYSRHVGSRTTLVVTNYPSWMMPRRGQGHGVVSDWLAQLSASQPGQKVTVLIGDPMCAQDDLKCWSTIAPVAEPLKQRWERGNTSSFTFKTEAHTQRHACTNLRRAVASCGRVAGGTDGKQLIAECARMPDADVSSGWRHTRLEGGTCSSHAPSTGLVAILHLLHRCRTVRVFGFGLPAAERGAHYWDGGLRLTREVNVSHEAEVIHHLRDQHPSILSIAGVPDTTP
jgi:hypothetical protein